jgi:hypothetical protein
MDLPAEEIGKNEALALVGYVRVLDSRERFQELT